MSEMVDRMARSVAAITFGRPYARCTTGQQRNAVDAVRSILHDLAVPTGPMLQAGADKMVDADHGTTIGYAVAVSDVGDIWEAMLKKIEDE